MIRLTEPRLTRIICEVDEDVLLNAGTGFPLSETHQTSQLLDMIIEGMDIALLEVRGRDYNVYERLKREIDDAAAHCPTITGVILTIPGPVRQVFRLPSSPFQVQAETLIRLVIEEEDTQDAVLVNSLNGFQVGQHVTFGGNQLKTDVVEVSESRVILYTETEGSIELHSRIYVDGSSAFDTNFTAKQLADIDFGLTIQFNYLSICFSDQAEQEIAQIMGRVGKKKTKILARVERMLGVEDLKRLVEATDGIVLERNALEAQMPIEKLCTYQKLVVITCAALGKPVLISGHVLGSLQTLPYPLRADACDVYNGVMDGSDGFVLSTQVLTQELWRNSMRMMKNIVVSAEKNLKPVSPLSWTGTHTPSILEALSSSAVKTCLDLKARYLMVVSHKGSAARLVSKYKPPVPILVLANDLRVLEQVLIHRGTVPMLADVSEHRRLLVGKLAEFKALNLAGVDESIVVLSEKNVRNVVSFQAVLSVIAVE